MKFWSLKSFKLREAYCDNSMARFFNLYCSVLEHLAECQRKKIYDMLGTVIDREKLTSVFYWMWEWNLKPKKMFKLSGATRDIFIAKVFNLYCKREFNISILLNERMKFWSLKALNWEKLLVIFFMTHTFNLYCSVIIHLEVKEKWLLYIGCNEG